MDPIATYVESLLHVRRQFDLYPDRVAIQADWRFTKRHFDQTVRLETLAPEIHYFYVRYRIHFWAGWILALGMLFLAILVYQSQGRFAGPFTWTALAVALLGGLTLILTHNDRRIRFARFKTPQGKPALDIAQAGPHRADFDPFLKQLRRQILKNR